MDLYYLNCGECFASGNELLRVNNSSQLYYIETKDDKYIAWNTNNDTYNAEIEGKNCLVNELNYYSVINNSLVLTIQEVYDLDTGVLLQSNNTGVKMEKLNKLLNIKGNQEYIFSILDVIDFLGDEKTTLNEKNKVKQNYINHNII